MIKGFSLKRSVTALILGALSIHPVTAVAVGSSGAPIYQPDQPTTGYGSSAAIFSAATWDTYGNGAQAYAIVRPDVPKLAHKVSLPVVVFFHGYGATNPNSYRLWVEHLVKRGAVGIVPVYQNSAGNAATYPANAAVAIGDALNELSQDPRIIPDTSKIAYVTHSLGAVVALDITARQTSFPKPQLLFFSNPGDWNSVFPGLGSGIDSDLRAVPSDTILAQIIGDADTVAGSKTALTIQDKVEVLSDRKFLFTLHSDNHGTPALKAGHGAALASSDGGTVDALDYYGYWKLADAAIDSAFNGKDLNQTLGNQVLVAEMGRWSDGVAVARADSLTISASDNQLVSITPKVRGHSRQKLSAAFSKELVNSRSNSSKIHLQGSIQRKVTLRVDGHLLIVAPSPGKRWPAKGTIRGYLQSGVAANDGSTSKNAVSFEVRIQS